MSIKRTFLCLSLFASLLFVTHEASAEVYELRTYTTKKDKLSNLHTRFRDHTVALFKKHGMESVGYWTPTDGPKAKNTLIYVLKHKSRDAAKASWKAFIADPVWKKAFKASRKDGPLLAKPPESVYMTSTSYTPKFANKLDAKGAVFELRIYKTNKGKLKNLDVRFKDNTIRIFNRHGMESVQYWHPVDEPESTDTLIYILKHKNREAANSSWKAFGADKEWKKVAVESQKDGKFLRERPTRVYMKATDYSAIK